MSPLMHAKKYSLQERVGKLLLIHGAADENDGTHTQQSERYFAALKAFGKLTIIFCIILSYTTCIDNIARFFCDHNNAGIESRLCILPHERHGYRAKESILHMAWEQEEWLKSLDYHS
jgi:dipeptidyl aminopeptidase/acylaminoacyl peptidase